MTPCRMRAVLVLCAFLCAGLTACRYRPPTDKALLGSHVWPRQGGYHTAFQLCYMIDRAKYELLVVREWKDAGPSTYMEVWPQPGYDVEAAKCKISLPEDVADRAFLHAEKSFLEFRMARDQAGLKGVESVCISYSSGIEWIGAQFYRGHDRDRFPSVEALLQELRPHVPEQFRWK